MNRIFTFFLLALFVMLGEAQASCKVSSPTSQDCTYVLTWEWEQGDGGPSDGFIVQQMADDNGEWYDIWDPVPITQKTLTDLIFGDKGDRRIDWRVLE
jgi:hypothetical protein